MSLNKVFPFSGKQEQYLQDSQSKINSIDGSVRSGKNFTQNARMLYAVQNEPHSDPKSDIAFLGTNKDAVEKNFLNYFFTLIDKKNYTYNSQKGKGRMFGRNFYNFPAKNKDHYKTIQGSNLGLALGTEVTLWDKEVYYELIARLSAIEDSRAFLDMNPESKYHWYYKEVIQNKDYTSRQFTRHQFRLEDNLSLTAQTIEDLKVLYGKGSLRYQRKIQGLWVVADGVIFSQFNPELNTFDKYFRPGKNVRWISAIDYGTVNPFVCGLFCEINGTYYLYDTYVYDKGKEKRQDDGWYREKILEFYGDRDIQALYIDPSAANFIAEINNHTTLPVKEAFNSVDEGIGTMTTHIVNKTLMINETLDFVLDEMTTYSWCDKSILLGKEKPLKVNDHAMDMIRYCLESESKIIDPFAAWRGI